MTNDKIIQQFIELFRGRGDCYGSAKGFCVKQPLTPAVFERHLTSTNPDDHIGVYCMIGTDCSWGCIDIDGKDFPTANEGVWDWATMRRLASNLQQVLAVKHIRAHRERTKNGFHLWVFPDTPLVPAAHMRRALIAACKAVGYDPKEVNPKAEGPRPGTQGLGNFVRLPYGGALTAEPIHRYMEDAYTQGIPLDTWLHTHTICTHSDDIAEVAKLWTPPPPAHTEVDYNAGLEVEPILKYLDGKTYTIWKDGPLPGSDRSTTLARLAHLCAEQGMPATHTFAIIKSADVRWGGKFANRADGLEQMARIVENAYT